MSATPKIIRIEGEEDLASLPCIHFATRGGHVLYGLPDRGLIHIPVSEDYREVVRNALITMEASYEHIDNQSDREPTA